MIVSDRRQGLDGNFYVMALVLGRQRLSAAKQCITP
jgi:hypothetical protein